jgi:hypothetical protein
MLDANVDKRVPLLIHDRLVDLIQHLEAFDDLSKDRRLAVQKVRIFAKCDDELGACDANIGVGLERRCGHADRSSLQMFQLGVEEGREGSFRRVAGYMTPY